MFLWIGLGAVAGWAAGRHLAIGGLGICLSTVMLVPLVSFAVLARFDVDVVVADVLFAVSVQVAYLLTQLPRGAVIGRWLGTA